MKKPTLEWKGNVATFGDFEVRLTQLDGVLFVDTYHRSQEESLGSIRLDTDEGTIVLYDGSADDAHTVFEFEEDDHGPRSMGCLVNDWHRLLQSGGDVAWGWDLFDTSHGFWEIGRDDGGAMFDDDDAAIAHVKGLAAEGSEAAQLALGIHFHPENRAFPGVKP